MGVRGSGGLGAEGSEKTTPRKAARKKGTIVRTLTAASQHKGLLSPYSLPNVTFLRPLGLYTLRPRKHQTSLNPEPQNLRLLSPKLSFAPLREDSMSGRLPNSWEFCNPP